MFRYIFFLSLISPCLLAGQKTHTIKKKYEVYQVLASDHSVKHGPYVSKGCNGMPMESGYYNQGLKDSFWDSYFYKGSYKNGEKVGVWAYYDFDGVVIQIYDHSSAELFYAKISAEDSIKKYKIVKDDDTILTQLERPPILLGRDFLILETLVSHMKSLKRVIKKGDSGYVYIRFFLDTSGILKDLKIFKGTGTDFDSIALNCVTDMKNQWLPGKLDSRPVSSEIKANVNYHIERKRFRLKKQASVTIGFY